MPKGALDRFLSQPPKRSAAPTAALDAHTVGSGAHTPSTESVLSVSTRASGAFQALAKSLQGCKPCRLEVVDGAYTLLMPGMQYLLAAPLEAGDKACVWMPHSGASLDLGGQVLHVRGRVDGFGKPPVCMGPTLGRVQCAEPGVSHLRVVNGMVVVGCGDSVSDSAAITITNCERALLQDVTSNGTLVVRSSQSVLLKDCSFLGGVFTDDTACLQIECTPGKPVGAPTVHLLI